MGRGYMTLPSESAAEIAELRLRVAALERQAGVRDTAYLLCCDNCSHWVVEHRAGVCDDLDCPACGCRSLYLSHRIPWPPDRRAG
jgi:hypothetical protein